MTLSSSAPCDKQARCPKQPAPLAAARDALLAAQQNFHEIILGVKSEVRVLFGPDSNQLAALGLKKKSDRSRPKRVAKSATEA